MKQKQRKRWLSLLAALLPPSPLWPPAALARTTAEASGGDPADQRLRPRDRGAHPHGGAPRNFKKS